VLILRHAKGGIVDLRWLVKTRHHAAGEEPARQPARRRRHLKPLLSPPSRWRFCSRRSWLR
jgi:hypothetical protein